MFISTYWTLKNYNPKAQEYQHRNIIFSHSNHMYVIEIYFLTSRFNSLKQKFIQIIFKNSVRTSKRTPHFTITKTFGQTCLKNNRCWF
jgi:hypothetical protein